METKIREIQPMVAENWVRYDSTQQEAQLIQPAAKPETESQIKTETNAKPRDKVAKPKSDPREKKEMATEVKQFIDDLNIGVSFEINDKSGDLVVQVLNRETGDVIRQIPPEDLVKLHEKLAELRGVIFEGKI